MASVVAVGLLVMVSGALMHARSPDVQAARLREQMLLVHRAVVTHYKTTQKLPQTPDEIRATLETMKVKGARRIKIASRYNRAANTVIYSPNSRGTGFTIQCSDGRGELLLDPNQLPYFLDQFTDSGAGTPR
ncbi:MAG: hypothetical protein VKN33_07980 [Candidatus Sericytochromatia bacterium]|nr:hypothetical protein [Candidatus Sericytochromatia bacterium]